MAQTKQSKRWLKEHFSDQYVLQARANGYRSRAAYKLLEIHKKDHLIKAGMTIIDLGAAPGGWSQVAAELAGKSGRVIASDILPMDPIPNVIFIQGDFHEASLSQQLLETLGECLADCVICDMSPNMSGMNAVDQPRAMQLALAALALAQQVLKKGGVLLIKLFHGAGFENYLQTLRLQFVTVSTRKPQASRARSREIYLLAKGFKRGSL